MWTLHICSYAKTSLVHLCDSTSQATITKWLGLEEQPKIEPFRSALGMIVRNCWFQYTLIQAYVALPSGPKPQTLSYSNTPSSKCVPCYNSEHGWIDVTGHMEILLSLEVLSLLTFWYCFSGWWDGLHHGLSFMLLHLYITFLWDALALPRLLSVSFIIGV